MSSVQIDRPTKMGQHPHNKKESENNKSRKQFNLSHKKHKHEDSRGSGGTGGGSGGGGGSGAHFGFNKFGRKRSQSNNGGKFFPPYKRRKKEGNAIIPPTKFLLGGNICDPLNLNSMQDEEVNRAMNAVTPKSSPLPTPKHKKEVIEVFPPNIYDPLNLKCNDNEEYEKQLFLPLKKASKRRNRKKKRSSSSSIKDEVTDETVKVKKLNDENSEVMEKKSSAKESPSEFSQSDRIQSKDPEKEQDQSYLRENKSESPQKDKSKGNVAKNGKIGNKFEREDKNKLRLKGLEEPKDKRLRKEAKDKIVSPVIPQPGAWKTRPQHRPSQDKKKKQLVVPNFKQRDARYQYGNYNRYYGYRNLRHEMDPRIKVFARRKEFFMHKDILDIGCNIGHITLSVARDLGAKSVTGIDIDRTLINIARKNIKHYVNCVQSPASNEDNDRRKSDADGSFFPVSMPVTYGHVDIPGFTKRKQDKGFPYNVTFVQGNYVLEDDALLQAEHPQFDTILCLSITKWIHLNFGDVGLKRAFKRMHAQLHPGGVLVLEPQDWPSYSKKKNLTERIYKNYHSIEFRPHNFTKYLLSSEVGFCKCEVISIPPHPSKGFQRPIYLFTKAGERIDDIIVSTLNQRDVRTSEQLCETERIKYEQGLFPKSSNKGSMSEISQQSSDLSQYEQLENVYAPSATPCYDTPSHNNEGQDAAKTCYVDMDIQDLKETEAADIDKTQETNKMIIETEGEANNEVNRLFEEDKVIRHTIENKCKAYDDEGKEKENKNNKIHDENNDEQILKLEKTGNDVNMRDDDKKVRTEETNKC